MEIERICVMILADEEGQWPVFVAPDLQTFVVVSEGTGRARYQLDTTKLTKGEDVQWFESLYELLRVIEVAAAGVRGCKIWVWAAVAGGGSWRACNLVC